MTYGPMKMLEYTSSSLYTNDRSAKAILTFMEIITANVWQSDSPSKTKTQLVRKSQKSINKKKH